MSMADFIVLSVGISILKSESDMVSETDLDASLLLADLTLISCGPPSAVSPELNLVPPDEKGRRDQRVSDNEDYRTSEGHQEASSFSSEGPAFTAVSNPGAILNAPEEIYRTFRLWAKGILICLGGIGKNGRSQFITLTWKSGFLQMKHYYLQPPSGGCEAAQKPALLFLSNGTDHN
ncbi:uncharacterized protein LY79DRAFT_662344 [Colletotrichum navitas]|uniref:Uncharacterized protein n=1 Tax=Colletotrichum navitas TaxID=681940 RepID=A0AAD8V1C8_9PEZI|nr:uncharacterized protein LY79DRAFT_662344 [Colletotrichum navitas]KAK1574184.1 hypothetical protein LY79DRAFT_662344 [Colletotrichum navitas]